MPDQPNRITLWIKDSGELISSLLAQIRAGVLLLLLAATLIMWTIPVHVPQSVENSYSAARLAKILVTDQ